MISRRQFLYYAGAYTTTRLLNGCNSSGKSQLNLINLPADSAAHPDPHEWWYWTGHLKSDDGRWFGFEQVIFSVKANDDERVIFTHNAITDITNNRFHYTSTPLTTIKNPSIDSGFDWKVGKMTAKGGQGIDILHGEVEKFTYDIKLKTRKPAVLQHNNGFTNYSFGGYTYYYSYTKMDIQGIIKIDGEAVSVSGSGWFDHQWGDLSKSINKGWDWFAIQLDDNREITIAYYKNSPSEKKFLTASISDKNGKTEDLKVDEIEVVALNEWTSPKTNCTYPQNWQISVRDISFTVTAVVADQEVRAQLTYWEGAASVTGDVTGRAYIELAGYC